MSPLLRSMVTAAAVVAAAGAGVWIGQHGLIGLPFSLATRTDGSGPQPTGPVIYYRAPAGRPFYSSTPRTTDDGRDYVPVLAGEDLNFDASQPAKQITPERRIRYYRNPMGLPDTSPVPKKDSMGMDYIPVYEGKDAEDGAVTVSLGKLQRTGVETTLVGRPRITRTIRAPGVVQLDERRIAVVAPRYDGYVIKVGAPTSGTHVMQGDELATVFGQELLNWGARLLLEKSGRRGSDDRLRGEESGVIGAGRRLENLGASDDFVEDIQRTSKVPDSIVIRAPMDGVVMERNVVEGQAFKAGDVLFRLADHSSVWMVADVPEGDIDAVKPGQAVTVTTRARPGRSFQGGVTVIYPHIRTETRTARVRIELANPDLALLPDMYGEVAIMTDARDDAVAVPASAVIDSGNRQVVLVDVGDGRFAPRGIKTGRRGDGFVEVLEGVRDGERVVVNGNFLIDAESNLQAALKAFSERLPTEAGP